MPQLIDPEELQNHAADPDASASDWRRQQRKRLTMSLDDIAAAVTTALQEAGLTMPIFFTIPSSGDALLTYATPLDPSDSEWLRAGQIVSDIVCSKIDGVRLRHQELPCAASGAVMGAADLLVGSGEAELNVENTAQ
jgi:hypothetical protein